MDTLNVKNFGPIKEANVEFGDLTILVGPQASGKSIFLQLLKLIEDKNYIATILKEYNYVWDSPEQLLELYFGAGMSQVWNADAKIEYDTTEITKHSLPLYSTIDTVDYENIFYIPAQRVISLRLGWPLPFSDYDYDSPYVLKKFSDVLRLYMNISPGSSLFADKSTLYSEGLYKNIFHEGKIEIDKSDLRKRFMLNINDSKIPYMAWSAGQKEIMPLYIGLKFLTDPVFRSSVAQKSVIIEEPEMGLHPQAIKAVILQIVDLISKGFKVIVSTHSPAFLEFAWAFRLLAESNANEEAMLELFELSKSLDNISLFKNILNKKINTYYFDRQNDKVIVKDISSLDAGSENAAVAEWGGLSSFASRASEIVAKNISL